jgi:hypothetical protein
MTGGKKMRNVTKSGQHLARMRSRRGSASVLIVLMVVLLAVFGAMALTAASANLRLARRHADWSAEYYRFDASAERLLAAADREAGEEGAATALADRLTSLRVEGIADVVCRTEAGHLTLEAVAGDPEGRGIQVKLEWPVGEDGRVAEETPRIVRWSQFQKPFVYGTEPGGLWDGKD